MGEVGVVAPRFRRTEPSLCGMRDAVSGLGLFLSRTIGRCMPDPFLLAIGLTLVAAVLAVGFGEARGEGAAAPQLLAAWWAQGIWGLLAFSMQMCLILITGHALAVSPPARRLVALLADLPRTPAQATALTALVAMGSGLLSWGLGLIIGALAAREVGRSCARRGVAAHYPLLGAAGYTGLLVWHGGLSGSAPLMVTQARDLALLLGEGAPAPIGLERTLLSPLNLSLNAALLVAVPLLLVAMTPHEREPAPLAPSREPAPEGSPEGAPTPAERLEGSRALSLALAALCGLYLWRYLGAAGLSGLDLNAINLGALGLGLALHPSLRAYGAAAAEAAAGCAGVMVQFPLYAGVMGLMQSSGLTALVAAWAAEGASAGSFAPLVFVSAGLLNLFVPSGGGQWALQGPLVLTAGAAVGADLGEVVMAFSYGDAWTNLLQPFWALPLLAITGLRARDLVGYTAALMLCVAPLYFLAFWMF